MNLKDITQKINEELKKDPVDRKEIIGHINNLINGYNSIINSLKSNSEESNNFDSLKKEIADGEKKYKKKVIDLYTIFEIAKELNSSLNIESLIKTIILTSMGHLLVETGVIFVFNEKNKKIIFKEAKGIKEGLGNIEFTEDEELIRYIKTIAKPTYKKEVHNKINPEHYESLLNNLNCELIVPFLFKNKMNGILFLGPKPGGIPFSDSNLEFIMALSNFAAIALENAQLYTDLDLKVRELSALYNISKEINKSDQINIVLDLMLETITSGFGVKKCSIILYNDLKNIYIPQKNYNIDEDEANKILAFIVEKKLDNALDKNEPILITQHALLNNQIFFSIPLVAGSKKVGLLNIYELEKNIMIDEDLKQIFSIIASQMAPPIVLTSYLSHRDEFKEDPYDYIYNDLDNMITKAKETGINFIIARLKLTDAQIDFDKIKSIIQKIKPLLQPTDTLIHSNYNELLLFFPMSTKEEIINLINDFIKSIANIKKVEHKILAYPEDGDQVNILLKSLYSE